MKKIYTLLALALILFATSCTNLNLDEAHSQGYNASLAAPICKFHSSIFEILEKADTSGEVKIDSTDLSLSIYWENKGKDIPFNFIKLDSGRYVSSTLFLSESDDIDNLTKTLPAGSIVPIPDTTIILLDTVPYKFNFGKDTPGIVEFTFDSVLFSKANLNLNLNLNDFYLGDNGRIELTITIPQIKEPQKRYIKAVITKSMNINRVLSQFMADITEIDDDGDNILNMFFEYKLIFCGNATITQGANIQYSTQFYPTIYDVAYGRFWDSKSVYDTIVGIKMPEALRNISNDNSNLMFHNPVLTLYLQNNLGCDFKYVIDYIYTLDKDGNILKFADFGGGTKSLTNYLEKPEAPHLVGYDTIRLDRNNGKTNELLCPMPDSMVMRVHTYVGKQNGGHNDFIVKPMKLNTKLDMKIEATLDAGSYYCTTDTMKADIAGSSKDFADKLKIQELHVMLLTMSSLPVNATASFYMLDSNNVQIYELEDVLIEAAEVDEHGAAISTTNQEIELVFEGTDIDAILQTKKMCLKVFVDGKDVESMISIHADNALDAEVSAFAKFKANLDNLFK